MDTKLPEAELERLGEGGENQAPDPSAADRIVDVFVSPVRAFAGLLTARNLGSIAGVGALLLILLSFATTFVVTSSDRYRVEQNERLEELIERYSETEGVSDDDIEEMERGFASQSDMSILMAFVSSLFSVPLMLLVLGVIVFGVSKVFEKGSQTYVRFIHAIAVAVLAIIPMTALALFLGVLQYVAGIDSSVVGLKPLVPEGNVYLTLIASAFTLPSIWGIVLLGVGTGVVARTRFVGPIVTYAGMLLIFMLVIGLIISQFPFLEPMISF